MILIKKFELIFLVFLISITVFLRFSELGYSHFYGDETKVLYLRKDTGASDFLLNQRKGPVQFVVAWSMEKLTGHFDEFSTRIPFALAGTLAVIAFYFLVKEMFNLEIAVISSVLFTVNGFFIAFSRTVQYQSFLLLFGILSLYFVMKYAKSTEVYRQRFYLILTGLFLALSYLAHWDAIFFDVTVGLILLRKVFRDRSRIKDILLYLVLPFVALAGAYYTPYFLGGYFSEHVSGYVTRRLTGSNQLVSSSIYTYFVYNPSVLFLIPYLFVPIAFLKGYMKRFEYNQYIVLFWFFVPFVVFELFFANPGTHIVNYIVPMTILAGVGIYNNLDILGSTNLRYGFMISLAVITAGMYVVSAQVFVPSANSGYPWKSAQRGVFNIRSIKKNEYQMFLYGFPYYRGWDRVRAYVSEQGGIRSYYTNDNLTIAEYYLEGVNVHKPYPDQMPEYYFYVSDGQEFTIPTNLVSESYVLEGEFSDKAGNYIKILKLDAPSSDQMNVK